MNHLRPQLAFYLRHGKPVEKQFGSVNKYATAPVKGTTVDIDASSESPVDNTTTLADTMAGTIRAQLFVLAVATTS